MRFPLLYYVLLIVQVGTACVGGSLYKSLPRPLRVLEWLMIFNVVESAVKTVLVLSDVRTLWMSHFYTIIELIFISSMYSFWMKNYRARVILLGSFIVFTLFWIASKFLFEPLYFSDDTTAALSKAILIVFSVYLLFEIVKETNVRWLHDSRFWVASSTVLYSAGSLFWYALFNKMLETSPEILRQTYYLNWVLSIISIVMYGKGFLCKR